MSLPFLPFTSHCSTQRIFTVFSSVRISEVHLKSFPPKLNEKYRMITSQSLFIPSHYQITFWKAMEVTMNKPGLQYVWFPRQYRTCTLILFILNLDRFFKKEKACKNKYSKVVRCLKTVSLCSPTTFCGLRPHKLKRTYSPPPAVANFYCHLKIT